LFQESADVNPVPLVIVFEGAANAKGEVTLFNAAAVMSAGGLLVCANVAVIAFTPFAASEVVPPLLLMSTLKTVIVAVLLSVNAPFTSVTVTVNTVPSKPLIVIAVVVSPLVPAPLQE
jgi:hypothetical protein